MLSMRKLCCPREARWAAGLVQQPCSRHRLAPAQPAESNIRRFTQLARFTDRSQPAIRSSAAAGAPRGSRLPTCKGVSELRLLPVHRPTDTCDQRPWHEPPRRLWRVRLTNGCLPPDPAAPLRRRLQTQPALPGACMPYVLIYTLSACRGMPGAPSHAIPALLLCSAGGGGRRRPRSGGAGPHVRQARPRHEHERGAGGGLRCHAARTPLPRLLRLVRLLPAARAGPAGPAPPAAPHTGCCHAGSSTACTLLLTG